MPTITNHDVIQYYDLTQQHMRWFWRLDQAKGLHYGIWDKQTNSLAEAITNTHKVMAELAGIKKGDKVLDAGCGVGGGCIYLAKNTGAHCTGITLSAKQVNSANEYAKNEGVSKLVNFEVIDYLNTGYPDESYDFVWALESMATAKDKEAFFKEMYRVLKPGGKLIIIDYYKPTAYDVDDHPCMQDMLYHWMIPDILALDEQQSLAKKCGYNILEHKNHTKNIRKSVSRIYVYSFFGMLGTKAYQITHPNVTPYSKNHYKTGYGQYHGYKKGLWEYHLWLLEKPSITN